MKENVKVSFSRFVEYFPEIALPVTLSDEAHHDFSQANDPLPLQMIQQFIEPLEPPEEEEEFTEYVPCFRLPDTHEFVALVYWRAQLMDYRYKLVTFTKQGQPIDARIIAGTFSDGKTLTKSVATIEEDWEILLVSGQSEVGREDKYDASTSTTTKLELLPDGTIAQA